MNIRHTSKSSAGWKIMTELVLVLLAVLIIGCKSYTTVTVPPKIDLKQFNTIGVIQFDSPSDEALAKKATQRFIEYVQDAQPGTLVVELGPKGDLLQAFGFTQLDREAVKAIKEKKSVDAVVSGTLTVSNPETEVTIRDLSLSGLSGRSKVKGELSARLWQGASGALAWSDSAHGEWTLTKASITNIQVNDPEAKYSQMVDDLVFATTRDFRPTKERREVEK